MTKCLGMNRSSSRSVISWSTVVVSLVILISPTLTFGQASLPTVSIYGNSIDPGVAFALPEPPVNPVWQTQCDRTPPGISTPKKPGGNGFMIKISGDPEKYVPGEGYSVTLQSYNKLSYTEQKFTGFILVVEPQNKIRSEENGFTQQVGNFELYGDALVKFSDTCANAIVQTSHIPKSSIQAMWRAPPAGSGCVVFKASVVEHKDEWRMDDDGLTKVLCEEEQESQDKQPDILDECCACDEAKYEMTFEGLWSRHTHPKDFPHGTLTHFSDIIGASHTGDFRIWDYTGYASEGVKHVAEMGSTRKLESELKAESEKIRTIIKARGLFFPNVTSKTFAVFRVDRQHHVMSLLSMLGPSPDWVVGVSALELCLKNCSWTTEKVMNLYPWDAGTDSGISYISPNQPTNPQEKIRQITSSFPAHDKSPFYDPTGVPMKPVARLTVTRQRVYEKSCDDLDAGQYPTEEPNHVIVGECAVHPWTAWGPCSVTCGKGVRMRTRSYLSEHKAREHGCVTLLVERETCEAICFGDVSCETTPWQEWSECSATCGKGFRSRKRKYKHTKARKLCALSLEEKDHCLAPLKDCEDFEPIPAKCSVTNWSEWSPCTATCGRGMKIRTRLHLKPSAHSDPDCNLELIQKATCSANKPDCNIDFSEAKEICMKPKDVGPCRGYFPRWYYHATRGMCLQFIYGGCRGNANNFERYTECNKVCEEMLKDYVRSPLPASAFAYGYYNKDASIHLDRGLVCAPLHTLGPMATSSQPSLDDRNPPVIDCVVTDWSEWTPCSRTCNSARRERRRMIKLNPENGGKQCPKKLVQRRKCKNNPPCLDNGKKAVDCLLSPWSEWSDCTKTCGLNGIRERKRKVKRPHKRGGVSCGSLQEREYCVLPPCSY